jgi:hypothetical protein
MNRKSLLKIVFACLFCAGCSVPVFAQTTFSKGDKVINLGVGVPTYLGGRGYSMTMPLVSGSFEYGIVDNLLNGKASIGIGGYMAYTTNKYESHDYYTKYSYFILGARGVFHYALLPKLDTYGGAMLGYNIIGSTTRASSEGGHYAVDGNEIGHSFFAGARYYFSGKTAVFGEVGYGIAPVEVGISFLF